MPLGPNLLIIGSAKAGSTSLYRYLRSHQNVFGSADKELMYFSSRYSKGSDWYESHFVNGHSARIRFEATPQYSFVDEWPEASHRIASYDPRMRIMYIVREPVARVVSQFNQWARNKPDQYFDINEALTNLAKRDFFVQRTKYWKQISAYRRHFPDPQIKVVFLEDLLSRFESTMGEIWEFLDLPAPQKPPKNINHNPHPGEKKATRANIDPQVYADLIAELRPDIQTFLRFYGKTGEFWGPDYVG